MDSDLDAIGVQLAGHRKKLMCLYKVESFLQQTEAAQPKPGQSASTNASDGEETGDETEESDEGSASSVSGESSESEAESDEED